MRTHTTLARPLAVLGITALAAAACRDAATPVAPVVPTAPSLAKGGPSMPPTNGRIYFTSNFAGGGYDVYSMKPDGSDRRRLTLTADNERHVDVSPDGKKLIIASLRPDSTAAELITMNVDGTNRRVLVTAANSSLSFPVFSPDGRTVAYVSRVLNTYMLSVWTVSVSGGKTTRLTPPTENASWPSWSPDGKRISHTKAPAGIAGADDLYIMNADGSAPQLLRDCPAGCGYPAWSPDGSRIIYAGWAPTNVLEIQYCDLLPSVPQCGNPIQTEGHPFGIALSPDGSQLVYTSFTQENGAEVQRVRTGNVNGSGQAAVTADLTYVLDVAWGR
jgi:Tol biopolymer transport system component